MKVLRVHNHYVEDGGESAVERAERRLLERAGHEVVVYERHNEEIARMPIWGRAAVAPRSIWNGRARRELADLLARERPDVAHFGNTFPLVSPSAYDACRDAGVPVVQALHNYRLLCPRADLLRDGRVCEDCTRTLWNGVRHACYRESRSATAVVAAMLAFHRRRGTWSRQVDAYVAPSAFARDKLVAGGLPAERVHVKPHFVDPDPGPREDSGEYALFVGRLAPEKGVSTLLRAWEELGDRVPLRIVGDGPLGAALEAQVRRVGLQNVRFLGRLPRAGVLDALRRARFLVFPSECYETFGLTIVEAFACGVPVLAANRGAAAELVDDGRTGLLFRPASPADLATRALSAWLDEKRSDELGEAAREVYEARYTAERNLEQLVDLYASLRAG